MPAYQHQSVPNMAIAGKTNSHHLVYIKVRVKFQVKAHSTLYNILIFWHFQDCCCKHVSIDNPAVIQSYPYKSSMTGRSHAHGCSRMAMINSRSLVYISPPTTPQWSVQDNIRHINVQQSNPNVYHWIMIMPQTQKYQSPGKYPKYYEKIIWLIRNIN